MYSVLAFVGIFIIGAVLYCTGMTILSDIKINTEILLFGPIHGSRGDGKKIYYKDYIKTLTLPQLEICVNAHTDYGYSDSAKYLKKELKNRISRMDKVDYHLYKVTGILPEN